MQFRNAVFVISEEKRCPLYNVGEELRINDDALTLPPAKSTCLILAVDIIDIVSQKTILEQFERGKVKKNKFQCGGCRGTINFEFKKEKVFATPQMKLLADAIKREKIKPITGYVGILRRNELFNSLSENDMLDLVALLEFENVNSGVSIVKKGEVGTHLYILLSGSVNVMDEEEVTLAQITPGGVFGEVSLLTGDRVTSTVVAAEPSNIAMLSRKDFKHVLKRFPRLQTYLYKLQAKRIREINLMRGQELSSGMAGLISDMPPAELFQMLNANRKDGHLRFDLGDRKGVVIFCDGEVVHAQLAEKTGVDAFYEILGFDEGRFKFIQGISDAERERSAIGGFMGMLMEGMKRLDDEADDNSQEDML